MEMSAEHLRGLYAVTDAGLQPPEALCDRVRLAIDGGARLIQYRDKSRDARLRREQARALIELCRPRGVGVIINDDVDLAAACGADGVHLGREDAAVSAARRTLGESAIVGASCYNSLAAARTAAEQGADYLAFGSFFVSRTKPHAVQAGVELVREAKQRWHLPVAAIGGITPDNAEALLCAGVDMLAVVRGVFAATDVRAAAARYTALFDHRYNKYPATANDAGETP